MSEKRGKKKTKRKRNLREIPERFTPNDRKVIYVLLKTVSSELPITLKILKKKTQSHGQTVLDIVSDLRRWGFMSKKEYIMNKTQFKRIKVYLKKEKKKDDDFHNSWINLPMLILIVVLAIFFIPSITYNEKTTAYHMVVSSGNFTEPNCVPIILDNVTNKTVYRDFMCKYPLKRVHSLATP